MIFGDLKETPAPRPMPDFRPLSRAPAISGTRDRTAEVQSRNEMDAIPLATLIQKHFGVKVAKVEPEPDPAGDDDELVGDTNFDTAGVNPDFFNTFQGFDDDQMREDGFVMTNQFQKAEFNEPPPRRFGSRLKRSAPRWKSPETDLFYRVLSMCGTDFSMMSKFFPDRTRKMIVNKFHCEEAKNRERVQEALANPEPLDLNLYAETVGITEETILDDYQRNRGKMTGGPSIPAQPSRRPPRPDSVVAGSSEGSEWENVESDQEAKPGDDDEIQGSTDF
jgi:transcription factor TFIIIB component B''